MKAVTKVALLCCLAYAPLPANAQSRSFSVSTRKDSIGNVQTGSTKTDSVTVTNTGTGTLTISSVKSSNARFTVGPASAALAGGASRKFGITFAPLATGAQSSFIIFTHNGTTSPDTVVASGTGTAPAFSVNRKSVAYGTVVIGTPKPDSVVVTNTGTAPLVISSVTSSNARYTFSPASGTVQPGARSTFRITFTPTAAGVQNGNIVFLHNAPTVRDTVAVTGTGTGFSLNRRSVAFGNVQVGNTSRDSVVVTNAGTTTLTISGVTSNNARFTVSPASASIPAAGNVKFYITFTPANTSSQTGSVVFVHGAPGSPDSVAVSGTGTLPGFSLGRKSVPFGFVLVGGNKLDSVTVTDTGKAPLVISSVTSSNGTFAVNPSNATIQPAQGRTFYITFTPSGTSPQSGNIVFTHNALSVHDTVAVTGTGGLPQFSVNRRTVPFGIVALGSSTQDSVSVTDTGTVALVITSVTSGNGMFTVNPANATIQASQSKTFVVTFTPANTLPQTGNIVFNHNAAGLHDTVAVSGSGATPGFVLNRRSIPFGNVVIGNLRLDSVTVTDTGLVPLVISSVTSSNGRFSVNPANATVQPHATKTFLVQFAPLSASTLNANLVFIHNAPGIHDTVTLSGTGIAPLLPPVLIAPANGATGRPVPDSLSWGTVAGATGYWLEMATDPQFTTIVINDSTLVSTARQVNGLPRNTLYYWRVGTRNAAGTGPFSSAWTLTTIPSGPVAGTLSFSGDASSTSYRMFGLPGIGVRRTGDIMTGTQKLDWRILRDTGKDTAYPAYYVDLTADSLLRTGEGYWLLQRKDLTVSRTDTLPPLGSDGTYGIPLHGGWNMISNPFNVTVQRSAVIAANALPAGTLFWEHVGATRTSSGTTLDPFKGYYFDNDTAMLATLKIPYPFSPNVARLAKAPAPGWRVELVFDSDINTDRDNYAGIAPGVRAGRNELDQHEPPLVFDQGFLYFVRPQWDPAHPRFATDIRGDLGSGQTWDFEVWNPRKGVAKISILGLDGVPEGNQAVLVNMQNTAPADMRETGVYQYQTVSPRMAFKLIVGPKAYVEGEMSRLLPRAYALEQNFPNPFNPSTTVRYMLPAPSTVRLEILSVIGQRVRLLDDGYRAAATYSVIWDGRDDRMQPVSSGVYFCRLTAGGSTVMTRKLLLLK
ncbi:MAG TPA: choice-of-anchor D domain-containing protein [Bacteroidota bacterium]|nr:choice-of-anchor D domain-containing protein [Bacteroidota bacterium]